MGEYLSEWRLGWRDAWAGLPRGAGSPQYLAGYDEGEEYRQMADRNEKAYAGLPPYVAPNV